MFSWLPALQYILGPWGLLIILYFSLCLIQITDLSLAPYALVSEINQSQRWNFYQLYFTGEPNASILVEHTVYRSIKRKSKTFYIPSAFLQRRIETTGYAFHTSDDPVSHLKLLVAILLKLFSCFDVVGLLSLTYVCSEFPSQSNVKVTADLFRIAEQSLTWNAMDCSCLHSALCARHLGGKKNSVPTFLPHIFERRQLESITWHLQITMSCTYMLVLIAI